LKALLIFIWIFLQDAEMMLDHYLMMKAGEVDEAIDCLETGEPAFGLPAL
jgi:flagellar biosynthesis component FlhA